MAKPNPFAGKQAPPFGKGGAKPSKPNPFAKKGAAAGETPGFFKKGGKVKGK